MAVVDLNTPATQIARSVVTVLEEALAAARAGNIDSVVVAYVEPDGQSGSLVSGGKRLIEMIGCLTVTTARLSLRSIEASDDGGPAT